MAMEMAIVTHTTLHWTDEIKSNLLIIYTHSPWRRTLHNTQGHMWLNWEQSEQVGDVGGRLCSIKGVRSPLVLTGGCE